MKKLVLMILLIGILVIPLAYTQGDKLSFRSIKAYVNGEKEGGTIDVKPNSTLELKIEVENTYSTTIPDAESDIEDIIITATIFNIDDGDDLEEESDEFNLDAGKEKTKTLTFHIPLEVEADIYDLEIRAEGEDGNRTIHVVEEILEVEVKKDKHKVIFTKLDLSKEVIECSGSTRLDIVVMNLGEEPEDDVELFFSNDDLGIDEKYVFDLEEDPFDDENTFHQSYTITVEEVLGAGIYPIDVKVVYDEGNKIETAVVNLEVTACQLPKEPEEEPEAEEEHEVIIIPEPPVIVPEPQIKPPEESFFMHYSYLFIIFGYILVTGILVIVGIKVFQKRK